MRAALFASVLVLALVGSARADTRRIAVIVGNNAGQADHAPLHFAEVDAGKVAQALVELGGVAPADLSLLQGRSLGELRAILEAVKQKINATHITPDSRVVLVFYFSGHSDGQALEVGREPLSFSELRRWLNATNAEVRVAIVDTCKSGALLAAKGGSPHPAFQIRLSDDLASSGEALLTSSAADELALESTEIRGSFFTHHLVSGLRGAADSSGDGNVTLTEAYQYAYAHTVSASTETLIGTQHPTYDYRLSGQGELVLASLSRPSASLQMPPGLERVLILQLARDRVIAELTSGAALKLAVPPGDYAVRAWRGGQLFAARLAVRPGEARVVSLQELVKVASVATAAKGDATRVEGATAHPTSSANLALYVAPGVKAGVARSIDALAALRVGLGDARPSGWGAALDASAGRGSGFWEMGAVASAGYRVGVERGAIRGFLGVALGVGVIAQKVDQAGTQVSPALVGAPFLGVALKLAGAVSVAIEGQLPANFVRRNGKDAVIFLPAVMLGPVIHL